MSNDGVHFSQSSATVTVVAVLAVHRVDASHGLVGGDEVVTVSGTGFVDGPGMRCRFGESAVQGTALSTTRVVCNTPSSLRAGRVTVDVSRDGTEFTGAVHVEYEYREASGVRAVLPLSGPATGGTLVSVFGRGFGREGQRCLFGGTESKRRARFVSETLVVCRTPSAVSYMGTSVDVSVRSEGEEAVIGAGIQFSFLQPISVARMQPSMGPELGGSVVTMVGSGFLRSAELRCRIGDLTAKAIWLSSTSIECIIPRGQLGNVSAEASNNGADFEGVGMWFEYVRAAQAGALSPSRGPIGGGTEVTIRGTAYSTGTDPSCTFGEAGTVGRVLNSTAVVCTSACAGEPGPCDCAGRYWVRHERSGF